MQSIVKFYNKFQKISVAYLLPIMPFDCILIRMGFEALCPPGLGIPKYAAIAHVLVEVLPKLLPKSNSHISTLMTVVCMERNNGFDLLWRIMALAVPGFDPTIPVRVPVWNTDNIFEFAAAFSLCYCLHGKKGVYQDDRTRSSKLSQSQHTPKASHPYWLALPIHTWKLTMDTYPHISVSWGLLRNFARAQQTGPP